MVIMKSSPANTIKQKIITAIHQCDKGQHNAAIKAFDELNGNIPEDTQLEILFGVLCKQLDQRSQAINYLSRTILREPDNAHALTLLGNVFLDDEKIAESLGVLERAVELQPNSYEPYASLGATNLKLSHYGRAATLLEQAVAMKPSDAISNANLAIAYSNLDRYDDAYKYAQKALKLDPKSATNLHLMGLIHFETGNIEQAIDYFVKAIRIDKTFGNAYADLARSRKFSAADSKVIIRFENALKESMPPEQRAFIHFGLGKIYDDCQEWDKAFRQFRQGNLLSRASADVTPPRRQFKQVKKVFTQTLLNQGELHGSQSAKPVFVVGMPRSGTTLIEQIIASHPQGAGAGELREIDEIFSKICTPDGDDKFRTSCARNLNSEELSRQARYYLDILEDHRDNSERIVDKMPENYFNLGLVHLLFPNATIIHTVRNPLDTCLSCYFQSFIAVDWSFDLGWIAERYCFYREVMDYWQQVLPQNGILTVEYENVVEDPEAQVRRILAACNLPWDPACLEFNQASRAVKTASLWQVRQPIYRTSKQRWVNYAEHLQPLIKPLSPYLSDEDRTILAGKGIKTGSGWNIRKLLSR